MNVISKTLISLSALLAAGSATAGDMSNNSAVVVGYTSGAYMRQDVVQMAQDCYKSFGFGARVANTKDLINTVKQGVFKNPAESARILIATPIAIGPTGPARLLFDVNTGYFIENDNTNELVITSSGSFASSPNSLKVTACAK
ncbi:hypothetical protein MNBD_GAMMA09-1292 [hydrothermal vent metagenome]|uniref:Uncharacterized protein n=1 Tax=hydrothermal vent metagenome TaxID=652676 RepID=A0A3B0Y6E3_9ZZZZ